MTYSKHNKEQCFVETHKIEVENDQYFNNVAQTYFEDFTDNHNKALVKVEIEVDYGGLGGTGSSYPCPGMVTVILETRNGKTIKKPITLVDGEGERAFQVEDLASVKILGETFYGAVAPANGGSSGPLFEAEVEIQKTFCICCPNDNDVEEAQEERRDHWKGHSGCSNCSRRNKY